MVKVKVLDSGLTFDTPSPDLIASAKEAGLSETALSNIKQYGMPENGKVYTLLGEFEGPEFLPLDYLIGRKVYIIGDDTSTFLIAEQDKTGSKGLLILDK